MNFPLDDRFENGPVGVSSVWNGVTLTYLPDYQCLSIAHTGASPGHVDFGINAGDNYQAEFTVVFRQGERYNADYDWRNFGICLIPAGGWASPRIGYYLTYTAFGQNYWNVQYVIPSNNSFPYGDGATALGGAKSVASTKSRRAALLRPTQRPNLAQSAPAVDVSRDMTFPVAGEIVDRAEVGKPITLGVIVESGVVFGGSPIVRRVTFTVNGKPASQFIHYGPYSLTPGFIVYNGTVTIHRVWAKPIASSLSQVSVSSAGTTTAFSQPTIPEATLALGPKAVSLPLPTFRYRNQFPGSGTIVGTVKEKGTPDKAIQRYVVLIDEKTGIQLAATLSDAATGAYSFSGLDKYRTYSALSYDYAGVYRAVIADNLVPS